jgi:hypothetical protein
LPRDRVGDLVNSGEKTPGEIVSYEPRIVEIHDFAPWSADEIIAAHRLANDARAAPRPSIKPFTRRSLRRGLATMLDRPTGFDARGRTLHDTRHDANLNSEERPQPNAVMAQEGPRQVR